MIRTEGCLPAVMRFLNLTHAPTDEVQATVYLLQVAGIDMGYQFAWQQGRIACLDLAVDCADWLEIEVDEWPSCRPADRNLLESRLHQIEQLLQPPYKAMSPASWKLLLGMVHFLASQPGSTTEDVLDFATDHSSLGKYAQTAMEALDEGGLIWQRSRLALQPAKVVTSLRPEQMADLAQCLAVIEQVATLVEQIGLTLEVSLNPDPMYFAMGVPGAARTFDAEATGGDVIPLPQQLSVA